MISGHREQLRALTQMPREIPARRQLICTLLFCSGLAYLVCSPVISFGQERLKASYEAAQRLFERGEDEPARAAFQKLLGETYRARAAVLVQQGRWIKANEDLEAAFETAPDDPTLRYELAFSYFRLDKPNDAARTLEPLVHERPADSQSHGLLGRVYFTQGKLAQARQELGAALRLAPDDFSSGYVLALTVLRQKDREESARIFENLRKSQGSPGHFHLLVGRAYLDSGYYTEAQKEFREALRHIPQLRFARYFLALSLLREREGAALGPAKEELHKELELYPKEFAARYLLGLLLEFERQWGPAAEAFRRTIRISPDEPDPCFHLGNVYIKLGRQSEAIELIRRALALVEEGRRGHFQDYRAHVLLSQAYRALGDASSSAQEATEASKLSAEQARLERERGMAGSLRTVLEEMTAPGQMVAWQEISRPVELTPDQTKLLPIYDQIIANGHNYLGLVAVRQQKFSDAARQFARLRNLQPDFPGVMFNLGLALFQTEKYSECLQPLERALAQSPSDLKTKKYLGLAYEREEQYDKAVKLLQEARRSDPDDLALLLALGTALARTNHPNEARDVFENLLKAHPNSAPLHVLWGRAFAAQHQPSEAEKEFRRALEVDPKTPSAHFYLGILKLQRGEIKEAGSEFEAELASHPDDSRARYHLAFVLLTQQETAQAIPLLQRVIQDNPQYAEAHYSFGKVLLEQDDVQKAIEHLETAVRLDPSKAYSHYQLGRAYLRAGRRDEAKQEFQVTQDLKNQQRSKSPRGEETQTP